MNYYALKFARNTGGKAGKGRNKTSTVQVVQRVGEGYRVLKQFRFRVGDIASQRRAVDRAGAFIKAAAAKEQP